MFGLWFAITGLLSGAICSFIAREKNRTQKNWYMLGQVFPIIAVIIISALRTVEDDENEGCNGITLQYESQSSL